MKKKIEIFIICILIPVAVGIISSALTPNTREVYESLTKPAISPPPLAFPIVWTILYILMGISSYLIAIADTPDKSKALTTYGIQLFFNFMWPIFFFKFQAFLPALIWIIILIVLIALMISAFSKINRTAAYLQVPYLLWCLFAAYLNLIIYLAN